MLFAPAVAASKSSVDVEARLAELARAGGPLRRVIAALSGRLVGRRSWERLGYARLGDYARERLGLSARSLQEFARVDAQLAELPRLEAALIGGALPWSKVRLLARFVSAQDEAGWIARARRTGVRALEREVRAVDRGALESGGLRTDEEGGAAEPTERVRIRAPVALAFKWKRAVDYAAKVAGERITPGVALELVTAEVVSALPVEGDAVSARADAVESMGGAASEEPPHADAVADVCAPHADLDATVCPLPPFLLPLMEGLDTADAFELDARLRRAVRLEQRLDAEIAPLLRTVSAPEYAWRAEYQSVARYARERLGMSPRKARALLRLERVGDVCPALRAAYRDGALSWVQAQALAPLLVADPEGEWRAAWVHWAQSVSVRRLEEVVGLALLCREAEPARWEAFRGDPSGFAARVDAGGDERQVCAPPTRWRDDIEIGVTAERDVARLFGAALCTVRRAIEREQGRLPTPAEGFEAMLDHALRSWGVDDAWLRPRVRKKYAVFERDGWRCTVPGCSSRRNLHAHHVVFRSAGGSDALENQTTLCAHHHQRGVHGGTVRVSGSAPDALWFELGTREGGPPLIRYGSGDRIA